MKHDFDACAGVVDLGVSVGSEAGFGHWARSSQRAVGSSEVTARGDCHRSDISIFVSDLYLVTDRQTAWSEVCACAGTSIHAAAKSAVTGYEAG